MIEDRLCEVYVSEWFGVVVGRVAGLLASRGPLTLPHLVQLGKGTLSGRQAKDALFVLLHHSFATWRFSATFNGLAEYHLDVHRIHLIIGGFGWLMRMVKRGYTEDMVELFKEVAVMGMVPVGGDGGKFEVLVQRNLCELVATLNPKGTTPDADEAPLKRARHDCPVFVRLSVSGLSDLWRSSVLYEYVKATVNESAAKIAMSLYDTPSTAHSIAMLFGKELRVDYSQCKPDGRSNAHHYLETLCLRFPFVQRRSALSTDRQTTTTYSIDRNLLAHNMRTAALLSTTSRRFGRPTARILKYTVENGPQEDRILSERLLMTAKEVRERFYQLLAVSLVNLQEIPKSADHAPARTIFLWSHKADLAMPQLQQRQMLAINAYTATALAEAHDRPARELALGRREAAMLELFVCRYL